MNRRYVSIVLSFCLFLSLFFNLSFSSYASVSKELSPAFSLEQANQVLQSTPSYFTENKGQWPSNILFAGNTDFGKVAFANDAIYYQMIQVEDPSTDPLDQLSPIEDVSLMTASPTILSHFIKLTFTESHTPHIQGLNPLPHYNNYLIGNDPSQWGIECRNFSHITYTNLWEGIDLAYFFTSQGLKYEYYVHPHAKIEDLRIQVEGADVSQGTHSLQMETTLGTLQDDQLLVYGQDTQETLNAEFNVTENSFSFTGIPEERNETIVIDPIVYSTYLGGSYFEYAQSIAIDATGHAYVTGHTQSSDFPMDATVGGPPAPGYDKTHYSSFNYDAFVMKLNPGGTELLYATFLGGSGFDHAHPLLWML